MEKSWLSLRSEAVRLTAGQWRIWRFNLLLKVADDNCCILFRRFKFKVLPSGRSGRMHGSGKARCLMVV